MKNIQILKMEIANIVDQEEENQRQHQQQNWDLSVEVVAIGEIEDKEEILGAVNSKIDNIEVEGTKSRLSQQTDVKTKILAIKIDEVNKATRPHAQESKVE